MNKKMALFAVFALVSTAMANAAQQDKKNDGKETTVAAARIDSASPADRKTASIPATTDAAYLIGPEDVLSIVFWRETSRLSGTNIENRGFRTIK